MKYIKIGLIGLGLIGCTNQPNVPITYGTHEKLTPIEQVELEDMILDNLNSIEKNHLRRGK